MWSRLCIAPLLVAAIVNFSEDASAQETARASGSGLNFKVISVPGPNHAGPRINIQIQPREEVEEVALVAPLPPGDAETEHAPWFWSEISPVLPANLERFWAAQDLLSAAPQTASLNLPRLTSLNDIMREHGQDILGATIGTQVSPALVLSVIAIESAGREDAESHAGAQGLMQLIPATAERFGVEDALDPAQNIAGGVAYLDWLIGEFGRDPLLVLAAYNSGEGAVRRAGGVPDFEETRYYVPKVLATWSMARSLCTTPPELISDGCVFQPLAIN